MKVPFLHSQENQLDRWFPSIPVENRLAAYCLAFLSGLFAFLGIITVFLPGRIVEREELLIFILGWLIVPVFAVLALILIDKIARKNFLYNERFLWALLAVNGLLFTFLTTVLNISWYFTKSPFLRNIQVYIAVFIVLMANGLLAVFIKRLPPYFSVVTLQRISLLGCLGFINFLGLFPEPVNRYQTRIDLVLIALIGGAITAYIKWLPLPHSNNRLLIRGFDFLVVLAIILTCFDPVFNIDIVHENFYLGPINRILHGGTMLVDTFSQYGVLVIYFLSSIFATGMIPLTYQGLSLIVAVLFMLHFIILYYLLIGLFNQRRYAIFLLGIILLLNFFGTMGIIQSYPSTGPLRFGLTYLLLAVIFIRKRFPIIRKWGMFAEYLLIGTASLWSFESFVYCAFPYLGICLYESFSQQRPVIQSLKILARRIAWFLLALLFAQSALTLFTYLHSGRLPDWATYLAFINTYSVDEFGTLLIPPWSPWLFLVCIYFASIFVFLFRLIVHKGLDDSPQSVFIFGLTLAGIAFFTYFLGRSHPNNLYHISAPAVILAGYGFAQANKSHNLPDIFRTAAKFCFSTAVILILLTQIPTFLEKVQEDHTGFKVMANGIYEIAQGRSPDFWRTEQERLRQGSGDRQVADALLMLQKYTPGDKDAVVFLSLLNTTEVLMQSDRVHHFPISDVLEDAVSGRIPLHIQSYPHRLKENNYIFLSKDPLIYRTDLQFNVLQIGLIGKLCQEFRFIEVESTHAGVAVMRLGPQDGTPQPYCETIRSLIDDETK